MKDFLIKAWNGFKGGMFKLVGGLIMEDKGGQNVVSLTRVLTIALFSHCVYVWQRAVFGVEKVVDAAAPAVPTVAAAVDAVKDIPPYEFYTLCGLLGIAGVKVAGTQVSNVFAAKNGGGE